MARIKAAKKKGTMPKSTYKLHSFIGHSFMCGFQDEDNEFINVAYFKLEKNKKEYVIKE